MRTWLCCVLALASGCIVPRSMIVGQTAAPVGRGATDIGVFTGVLYGSQTNPSFNTVDSIGDPVRSTERTQGFSIPSFEANLQHGFDDTFALNVHASSAGIQPGLKITANKSKVAHVAFLPEVAFGYGSTGGELLVAGGEGTDNITNPTQRTSFTFLGGLKVLVSVKTTAASAFYAAVGYDFLFNRNYNASFVGTGNVSEKQEIIVQTTAHQVTASVGFDISLGWVHLRPEVAFAVYPGIGQNRTTRVLPDESTIGGTGGFGFAIFPGFSLAIQTPKRELTQAEQEEEVEKAEAERRRRRRNGDDDDEDEDDNVRKPQLKKKRQLDDDEEEDNPRKKRRPLDNDDED